MRGAVIFTAIIFLFVAGIVEGIGSKEVRTDLNQKTVFGAVAVLQEKVTFFGTESPFVKKEYIVFQNERLTPYLINGELLPVEPGSAALIFGHYAPIAPLIR